MSGSSIINSFVKLDWRGAIPVFRYAIGSTLILAVATGAGYMLSYITPVLALMFLAPDVPPLSIKSGIGLVIMMAIASFMGVYFSKLFLGFPMVFIPLLALAMLHLYYSGSINPLFKILLIISLLLIPLLSTFSPRLGGIVAISLVMNAIIVVMLLWSINLLFPTPSSAGMSTKPSIENSISNHQRYKVALRSTIVILPVVVCFYVFQWAGSILVMVFVVILSMNPETANFKTGKLMIIANLAGGIAAILAFNLFTLVPAFIFLIMITLIMGLYFGQKVFSGKPAAPLYGTAFSTYLLVLGSVTTSAEGDAGEKVWARIFQIGIAVTYVVIAFGLFNHFTQSSKKRHHENNS